VFCNVVVLYPAQKKPGNALVDDGPRQYLLRSTQASYGCNPFPAAILDSCRTLLCLSNYLREDSVGVGCDANKKALFVHIVGILWLYVVLLHL
jgi:hypothetical protein